MDFHHFSIIKHSSFSLLLSQEKYKIKIYTKKNKNSGKRQKEIEVKMEFALKNILKRRAKNKWKKISLNFHKR
jgi:hypothetical protein